MKLYKSPFVFWFSFWACVFRFTIVSTQVLDFLKSKRGLYHFNEIGVC